MQWLGIVTEESASSVHFTEYCHVTIFMQTYIYINIYILLYVYLQASLHTYKNSGSVLVEEKLGHLHSDKSVVIRYPIKCWSHSHISPNQKSDYSQL